MHEIFTLFLRILTTLYPIHPMIGRGGMGAKIDAAFDSVKHDDNSKCTACVIVGGYDLDSIRSVLGRKKEGISYPHKGTLFVRSNTPLYDEALREMELEIVSQNIFLFINRIILYTCAHIFCNLINTPI